MPINGLSIANQNGKISLSKLWILLLIMCRSLGEEQQSCCAYRQLLFASVLPVVLRDALRNNHKSGTRHLARPILDVECAGRYESFEEVCCMRGFAKRQQSAEFVCSSVFSSFGVIAFEGRRLAPRRHGLLCIVVRIGWPWCVVVYDGEP